MIALQALATLVAMIPAMYLLSWLESKLAADLQARVGPSRAGAAGWLQPLADLLRLIQKYRPGSRGGHSLGLWWLQGLPLFALLAVTPMGPLPPMLDTPLAPLLVLMLAAAQAWTGTLLGWRSGGVEERFASLRQLALMVAGLPPALLSMIHVGFDAGGLSWAAMVRAQGWAPWSWTAFSGPISFVSACLFILSGQLLFASPPFHGGVESQRWMVASQPGEIGVRLLWSRLSQRIAQLCWALLAVRLYFGGADLPGADQWGIFGDGVPSLLLGTSLALGKSILLLAGLSAAASALPSVRADQAHEFSWRVLSPLALLVLLLGLLGPGGSG